MLRRQSRFDLAPNTAVVTTSWVTRQGMDILLVSHERDDDVWQFHCGNGDHAPERLMLVALSTIVALDPTVNEVAGLPAGYTATRQARGGEWVIRRDEEPEE